MLVLAAAFAATTGCKTTQELSALTARCPDLAVITGRFEYAGEYQIDESDAVGPFDMANWYRGHSYQLSVSRVHFGRIPRDVVEARGFSHAIIRDDIAQRMLVRKQEDGAYTILRGVGADFLEAVEEVCGRDSATESQSRAQEIDLNGAV